MLISEKDEVQHQYLRTLDNYVTNFEDTGEIDLDDMIKFCKKNSYTWLCGTLARSSDS